MHIKFLPHGEGSAARAAAYVLDELDHMNIERAGVDVLRGDPRTFAAIADGLEFKHRYTSGVIAWAGDDEPTLEEIDDFLKDFERTAFAGLEPAEYHFCAVMHTEADGSKHVHVLVPRVNLATGKSLNIAPPNWEKTFDPLRDAWNNEKGWARPDDPVRARLVQPQHFALVAAAAAKAGLQVEPDSKHLLASFISQRVEAGLIQDRAGVIASLAELGEITRQGKDYLSIKPDGFDKAIRLKGALFDEQFSATAWLKISRESKAGRGLDRGGREKITQEHRDRASAARQALEEAIGRRSEYNQRRYHRLKQELEIELGQGDGKRRDGFRENDQQSPRQNQPANRDGHEKADVVNSLTVSDLASRFVGRGASNVASHTTRSMARNDDHGNDERQQGIHGNHVAKLDDLHNRQKQIPMQGEGITENDRIRNIANSAIQRIIESVRTASEAVTETVQRFAETIKRNQSAIGNHDAELSNLAEPANTVIQNGSRIAKGVAIVRENNTDEIERFKREINLVEFAQVQGYEYDKKESSKASAVLRKDREKIIVATDKDGHGIYFNVGDNRDNGSIVDFVQRRQNLNIGQARKVLRPWVSGTDQPTFRMTTPAPKPIATSRDRGAVIAAWERLQHYKGNYLQTERKLSEATIAAFGDRIRQDERGNVCFRHIDQTGITGYEIKNKGFTAFATGGEKAVFTCRINENQPIARVVVVESAIDAMSYHELRGNEKTGTLFLSFAGGMSDKQKEVLKSYLTLEGLTDKAEIIAATDNDKAGNDFAAILKTMRPDCKRESPTGKDWNDDLKAGVLSRSQRFLERQVTRTPKEDYDSPSLG
jgi:hypothetical protein